MEERRISYIKSQLIRGGGFKQILREFVILVEVMGHLLAYSLYLTMASLGRQKREGVHKRTKCPITDSSDQYKPPNPQSGDVMISSSGTH